MPESRLITFSDMRYDRHYQAFRWELPARFNIAHAYADAFAASESDRICLISVTGNAAATTEKFRRRWLMTGDQGVMDEPGHVDFFGREDGVITSAGYRIRPGEVEDCLMAHPAVSLAAVVGKPDPLRTEIIKAYVIPAEGFRPDSGLAAEVQRFVRQKLSAHEYPREVAFVEEMPLTTSGKIIRRVFRDRAKEEASCGVSARWMEADG